LKSARLLQNKRTFLT